MRPIPSILEAAPIAAIRYRESSMSQAIASRSSARPILHPSPMSLLPLYVVIFFGFVGYSLMITVFTPMFLKPEAGMLPASATTSYRTVVLGIILGLYPAGQFIGSPVMGAMSDRYGRRPILLISLAVTTACYAVIASALQMLS